MENFQGNFVIILGFLGEWFLFSFPLLQAFLELTEYQEVISSFKKVGKNYHKISPWFWIIPPLKIYLERKRLKQIISDADFSLVNKKELKSFELKAIAWFYVSMAGAFNGIGKTGELIHHFGLQPATLLFWVINCVMLILGVMHVILRMRILRNTK